MVLTVRAVLAPPALQAESVPVSVTGVVAEGVVAEAAVGGAVLAVVELAADHVVGEPELALVPRVDVLGPLVVNGQLAARGQAADEVVLVLWRKRGDGGLMRVCQMKLFLFDNK